MIFYQVTIETLRYNLFKCKWVLKSTYPSTLIFDNDLKAWAYTDEFIKGLKRRGVKLKEGRFKTYISKLKADNA